MVYDSLIIRARSVAKSYGSEKVLADFNLDVWNGAIVGILGVSGSVKTTALRLIAGFEKPDSGIIEMRNEVISSDEIYLPPEQRNVGMVFQDYALFPHLNVFENVGFGLGRKIKDRNVKIQNIVEMIDLNGHEKKYPNQLSGGQQQRVAIGRALAINPSAILMDEPFSNLDFSLKSILSNEVKKIIRSTGTTTIMVTHDEREAERLSDECYLLENGKIKNI